MKIKRGSLLVSAFLLAVMLISMVSAFGVASPYYPGHPLVLAKGETQTVNLNLQNMVGDQDVNVRGYLAGGADIASLSKIDFLVKAKTSDTMVPVQISIPKDAQTGQTIKVTVGFLTVNTGGAGTVSLDTAIETSFDVQVSVETAKTSITIYVIIGIIILLILIIAVLLGKKKSHSRKK